MNHNHSAGGSNPSAATYFLDFHVLQCRRRVDALRFLVSGFLAPPSGQTLGWESGAGRRIDQPRSVPLTPIDFGL